MSVNIFEYGNGTDESSFLVDPIEEHNNYTVLKLSYKSPIKTIYEENNNVVSYVYKPHKKCNRVVIFLHYLFEKVRLTQRILSLYFVAHDFCAVEFTLPYHLERTPEGYSSGELFLTSDPYQNFEAYRQAVVDLRLLADFLNFKGIDKIGISGISIGALVLNTLMGIDKRFIAGVPIAGGGGLHYIVSNGVKKRYVKEAYFKKHGISPEEAFRKLDDDFHKYLQEVWSSGGVMEPFEEEEKWFLIDPLTYAKFNYPRNIFMINGAVDSVIPKNTVLEFREAVGNPPIEWLPTMHTTTALLLPFVFGKMYEFFEENL
jgi:hypothetical protein